MRARNQRKQRDREYFINPVSVFTPCSRFRMESSSLHVGTLVRLTKVLRVSLTGLLGESMSARQWLQMGEARFATREDAED